MSSASGIVLIVLLFADEYPWVRTISKMFEHNRHGAAVCNDAIGWVSP